MSDSESMAEWKRGWPLVVAGATGVALTNFHIGAIGAVMQPLQAQFGWTRAEISASILIVCSCVLVLSPAAGFLVDRFGARRVGLIGLILFSIAFCSVGLAGPSILSWYLVWALVGVVFPTGSTIVWTLGVGSCFVRQRGLAFALTIAGAGVSMFLSPLLSVALLPIVGWRGVFLSLGVGALVIGWPVVWALFHPDRIAQKMLASTGAQPVALSGYDFRRIAASVRFWSLSIIVFLVAAAIGAVSIHLQPIMRDAGLSAAQAAGYASLIGPAAIGGHFVAGYLLDRFPARYVGAVFIAAPAIVCGVLLNYDGSVARSLIAVLVLGGLFGVEGDLVAYLTASYFGLKRYGVTYGVLVGLYSFGFGVSPVVAGAMFDTLGSYTSVLWLLIGGVAISSLMVALLGPPPDFGAEPNRPD